MTSLDEVKKLITIFGLLKVLITKFGIIIIVLRVSIKYILFFLFFYEKFYCFFLKPYIYLIIAFKAVENIAHKSSDEEFKNYHGFNGLFYIQDSNSSDSFDIIRNVFKVVKNL